MGDEMACTDNITGNLPRYADTGLESGDSRVASSAHFGPGSNLK